MKSAFDANVPKRKPRTRLSTMLAEIERKAFRGAEFIYTLKLASSARVLALVPSHHDHAIGEKIGIRLNVEHVIAFGLR